VELDASWNCRPALVPFGRHVPVTSWRDSATPRRRTTSIGLANAALSLATQMLENHGEFYPYGVALDGSGEARMVAGDPGQGERPASVDVLATLVAGLRTERDALRAIALVSVNVIGVVALVGAPYEPIAEWWSDPGLTTSD
jgi:hypothetical protein